MIDDERGQRVLGAALRTGGDFAEVFVEDKRSSSARLDDGRVEELSPPAATGAPASGSCPATPPATPTPPTSPRTACAPPPRPRPPRRAGRWRAASHVGRPARRQTPPAPNDVVRPAGRRRQGATRSSCCSGPTRPPGPQGAAITPGERPRRRQPPAHPRRQQRRPARRGRPGRAPCSRSARRRPATPACRPATRPSGTRSAGSCSTATTSRSSPAGPPGRPSPSSAARPAPGGAMPVVIGPGGGGVLFHEACGHGLEADLVGKGASVFRGRIGEQVGLARSSRSSTTAPWPRSGAASPSTTRARPAQRNVLIEDGVLTDYMWDLLRAPQGGPAPVGQRPARRATSTCRWCG